jgi:hypothetical protein
VLRLQFGNNWDLGIDNISFEERASGNSSSVPVPPQFIATALGAGLGALKLRRQSVKAKTTEVEGV